MKKVLLIIRDGWGHGKHNKGMDNRVARLGILLGLIHSTADAKRIGLKHTDLKDEIASLTKQRLKAQPKRTS